MVILEEVGANGSHGATDVAVNFGGRSCRGGGVVIASRQREAI